MFSPVTEIQKIFAAGVEDYLLKLLKAVGSGLDVQEQQWLTQHLVGLPDYLTSPEGKEVIKAVIACYKSYPSRLGETNVG